MAALLHTLSTLWFHECRASAGAATLVPLRPWYPHKRALSFTDVLRAAQQTFARVDRPSKLPALDDFARRGSPPRITPQLPRPFAA
jgi:hypothetical protein